MSSLLEKYKEDETVSFDEYQEESLANLNFEFDSIEEVVLEKCSLDHVVFRDLYMKKVTFKNCTLTNCYFMNINASEITFLDSKLTDVVFDEGKVRKLEIIDSLIQFCTFSVFSILEGKMNSRFIDTAFSGVSLSKCDFLESYFEEWKITKLDCEEVDLSRCKLNSIKGDISSLKGATLSMEQAFDIISAMGIIIKELA